MDMVNFFSVETQSSVPHSVLENIFCVSRPRAKGFIYSPLFQLEWTKGNPRSQRILVSQLGPFKPLTYTDRADSELFLRCFRGHGCPLFCSNPNSAMISTLCLWLKQAAWSSGLMFGCIWRGMCLSFFGFGPATKSINRILILCISSWEIPTLAGILYFRIFCPCN